MKFQFSFLKMDPSENVQNYARNKLQEKIERFVAKPVDIKVVFSTNNHNYVAECFVYGGNGLNIKVEQTAGDTYSAVDKMITKLTTQLKRHKEKIKSHKGRKLCFTPEFAETEEIVVKPAYA